MSPDKIQRLKFARKSSPQGNKKNKKATTVSRRASQQNPLWAPLLTADFVSEALGLGPKGTFLFSNIETDSRKVVQNSLFVAIKGEIFDGHRFIGDAIRLGAGGIITQRKTFPNDLLQAKIKNTLDDVKIYQVNNTVEAFRKIAGAWRERFSIPVVVIAGSIGKTTTKELTWALLKGKWKSVLKTLGSQNGFLGIPMTLMSLNEHHEAAVIEIGIDEPGTMVEHLKLVNPNLSLVTAICPEHMEHFHTLETVAREECIALTYTTDHGGTALLNLNDPWIARLQMQIAPTRQIGYALETLSNPPKTVQQPSITAQILKPQKRIRIRSSSFGVKNPFELELPLPGTHNAQNLLAATTIAIALGLTKREIQKGLQNFEGQPGRSELKCFSWPLKKGRRSLPAKSIIICDYYNASPDSMKAGLAMLQEEQATKGGGYMWACLADMLELGTEEELYHRCLAEAIVSAKIDRVLLFGERMKVLMNELKRNNTKPFVQHFKFKSDLAAFLCETVNPGDLVLIKGSRSMKMEEVWEALAQSFKKSGAKPLPRRTKC